MQRSISDGDTCQRRGTLRCVTSAAPKFRASSSRRCVCAPRMLRSGARRAWSLPRSCAAHASSGAGEHWLHARFPRLSARLDSAAHAAWLRCLRAAVRASAAAAREEEVVADARARHEALLARHAFRAKDRLAATHVAAAARVAASAAALAPVLRDGAALRDALRDAFGLAASPLTRSALAAALLFAPEPRALATAALRALQRDYGQSGFAFAPDSPPGELVITRCLYADVFAEEAQRQAAPPAAQLLAATCCSLDTAVWFDLLGAQQGAAAERAAATPLPTRALRALRPRAAALRVDLTSSIARGDDTCCMRIVDT